MKLDKKNKFLIICINSVSTTKALSLLEELGFPQRVGSWNKSHKSSCFFCFYNTSNVAVHSHHCQVPDFRKFTFNELVEYHAKNIKRTIEVW